MLKTLDCEKQAILCLEVKAFDYFSKEIIPVGKAIITTHRFAGSMGRHPDVASAGLDKVIGFGKYRGCIEEFWGFARLLAL
jgi:hypothetical protein